MNHVMNRLGSAVMAAALSLAIGGAALAQSPARTITVPGHDVAVRVWEAPGPHGEAQPHYAIALDGRDFAEARPTDYLVRLRHGSFDPLGAAAPPAIEPGLAAGDDTNVHIVQFVTQPLEAYRDVIRDLGGTVSFFLPRHCHLVRMDRAARDAVAALPFVRWVGPYHPAYRLEAELRTDAPELQHYNILLHESDRAVKAQVAADIRALGGVVHLEHAGKYLVEATLTPDQLAAVVRWDDVLFIDRWSPYEADMNNARENGGANYVETVAGYTGAGVRGEVIDIGFNVNHVDFNSNPLILHTSVSDNSHGAATSGIIFGDGTGNPPGEDSPRGLAPDAQGIVASTDVMVGQARYDHTAELVQPPYEAVFQSASVGSDRTFFYTTISADTDAMLFDFDILHCQSQSNAGNQDSRPQAWAKNIVSVGGAYHQNTLTRADDSWSFGGSIGPASDGRIKPDLVGYYDDIRTTTTGSSTAYTNGFGGTSGATPIVAGHFALFYQMWDEGIFGNDVDALGSVFDNRCHMTTAKAIMINTASPYDWTQGGPNADIDRFKQGWGMPDLQALYDQRNKMLIVDETDVLTNLASTLYTVDVDPGEPALRATLVYADPPGNPAAAMHRINDLNLKVTSPSGTIYWGNNGLVDGNVSTPGGVANELDTVENVWVENPEPGLWSVEVIAAELVQDGHVETFGSLDADYALVVSGVEEQLPPLVVRVLALPPALVPPGTPAEVGIEITAGLEGIVPGSETLHYRFDSGDDFTAVPLVHDGGDDYTGTVPGAPCDAQPEFYVSAAGDGGTVVTNPSNAPASAYGYSVGEFTIGFEDDFETDNGWTVVNEALTDGGWDRGVPAGGGDRGDPPTDYDGSGQCYLTDNEDGNSDVDGGPTRLLSPVLDATGLPTPVVRYARWFTNDDQDIDRMVVEISDDKGITWTELESVGHQGGWVVAEFLIADYVTPNDQLRLRFSVTDNPNDSVTEAAVDAIVIDSFVCEDASVPGDVDGDGLVGFGDLLLVLSTWGDCPAPPADCPEDVDGSGAVDFGDVLLILSNWS